MRQTSPSREQARAARSHADGGWASAAQASSAASAAGFATYSSRRAPAATAVQSAIAKMAKASSARDDIGGLGVGNGDGWLLAHAVAWV
jgi:hypothetical protein